MERWTPEHVLSLAPDAPSRKAATKLSAPAPWSGTGCDTATPTAAVWGECKGSGSTPYRTVVDLTGPAYQCSCPSRKFPCKHALALLLRWSAGDTAEAAADAPAWAADWLKGPRDRSEQQAARSADTASAVPDPAALLAAERRRERRAARVATGYQRVEALPEPLAATVRARVGFTVDAADVLRGPRLRDRWLVLGGRDSADERVTTRRIWLRGLESGRDALLLSFGRPGLAPELALPTGLLLDAELAFHPGARPLRAVLGARYGVPAPPPPEQVLPTGLSLDAALDGYGRALGDDPWLESWPVVLHQVVPAPTALGWELADRSGPVPTAIPVDRRDTPDAGLWRLAAVSAGRPITVFGECGHRGFTPVTAWYPEGSEIRTLGVSA